MKLPGRKRRNKKIDFRAMHETERLLRGLGLHTVCVQARCPNISECFNRKTATFLILGDICTRRCGFCGVRHGMPGPVDPYEPGRVVEAAARMGLRHLVATSVTRDDLDDGGAGMFAELIRRLREHDSSLKVEVLVPDFRGDESAAATVALAGPDIFGHNIETVPSLYPAKKGGDYNRSLAVLSCAKACAPGLRTKSGLLLGLGETEAEVVAVFHDLRSVGCDYLSIGQYLQPGRLNLPVREYVSPEAFERYKIKAHEAGFFHVESGAYVRSSYLAERYEQRS
ncbi:MAG: lipoyl synthase [Spirochaetes bacterium RBG_16_49_21]|nr:MAG: lipoyl synthase [Spirochaetes bacterium RBG_16_49_21]